MGRIFGILFICLGIWVGLEIYLEGTQRAFGGAFASGSAPADAARSTRTTPQRAGDAATRARDEGMRKLEDALPE